MFGFPGLPGLPGLPGQQNVKTGQIQSGLEHQMLQNKFELLEEKLERLLVDKGRADAELNDIRNELVITVTDTVYCIVHIYFWM